MTHFAIGHNKGNETESVFTADTLAECINEWKKKEYQEPEYFIDIWETIDGTPYPIADVKIQKWVLDKFVSTKKKFRVWAKSESYLYIDVEADDQEEAINIGRETDGGDFIAEEQDSTWSVYSAEKIDKE